MPIPDYQTAMLPLLQFADKHGSRPIREAVAALGDYFKLSDEERSRPKPSGKQPLFHNRVHWAKFYLMKAGLLAHRRGVVEITPRGREALKQKPKAINLEFLRQYPEFIEFLTNKQSYGSTAEPKSPVADLSGKLTPEEMLERGHLALSEALQEEMLDLIMAAPPEFFEALVVDLLLRMGYGGSREDAGESIGRSHDGGVDGIIKEDRLGLDVIYLQAKRWKDTVGSPEIDRFIGALHKKHAVKGVFITTSSFTKEARDAVKQLSLKIVLLDGRELAALMVEHDLGVTTEQIYAVKRVDSDYFAPSA